MATAKSHSKASLQRTSGRGIPKQTPSFCRKTMNVIYSRAIWLLVQFGRMIISHMYFMFTKERRYGCLKMEDLPKLCGHQAVRDSWWTVGGNGASHLQTNATHSNIHPIFMVSWRIFVIEHPQTHLIWQVLLPFGWVVSPDQGELSFWLLNSPTDFWNRVKPMSVSSPVTAKSPG